MPNSGGTAPSPPSPPLTSFPSPLDDSPFPLFPQEEILSSESKVVTLATQREGRKANLRDNLLKRKAELEMAMVELGDNDQTRRSSVPRVSSSSLGGGHDDDAMELESEEESDPLRVDLQLLEHNVKEIDEELASLEATLSTRKDEVSSFLFLRFSLPFLEQVVTLETILEELKTNESDRENEIMEKTKLLDKLLNERNMLLDTIQQKQRLIRELGSLPKKEIDELTDLSEKVLLTELKVTHEKLKQYSGVNRKAMEQFVSFNEQRQSLVDRKDELVREKESIEHLISSLDLQKEDTIFTTFQTVSQHFKEVFRELVRGGSGELVMITDMEEGGEGEEGLSEEKGSPQSKKKSSMSSYRGLQIKVSFSESSQQFEMNQLSGGQKALVALAFIFAIQRCDPAPFYLFDEIDQALDANYRTEVARLISQQVNHSDPPAQFITTTFRPEMVSVANQCYGIALQNKSSHIYSITKVTPSLPPPPSSLL
jgi:structural maintenance of chromosome 3 (chondroitin sulfate proteoglycan 6)